MIEKKERISEKSGENVDNNASAKNTEKVEVKPIKKSDEPKKSVAVKKTKDIGIDVPPPSSTCDDVNCPFHGELPVRGYIITGRIVSDKMNKTVVVKREYMKLIPKYERYEKRTNKYSAHNPPCINATIDDEVTIAECRPLSKTVSFVVVSKKRI